MDWDLAATLLKRQKRATSICRKYTIDEAEAEECAVEAVYACASKGGVSGDEKKNVDAYFSTARRFAIKRKRERIETPLSHFVDENGKENNGFEDRRLYRPFTPPDQEQKLYFKQCMVAFFELPAGMREIMIGLAKGYSPIDLAKELNLPVKDVLFQMRVAREWMGDYAKFG